MAKPMIWRKSKSTIAPFYHHHAMIVGGSSGIGKATAQQLAQSGAHLSIIARTVTTLEAAKAEIESARIDPDQRVISIAADITNAQQIEQAIQTAIRQQGTPHLLIVAAGMAHSGYFRELPIEVFERTMAVNYFGSLYAIKAVLPAMEQRRQGHIVLISSGAGLVGIYGYTPYSPSKFALRGLAESLRGELKASGIHLSIVYPPDTDTPQLLAENQTKPIETQRITGSAKTWQPEDVARVILRGIQRKDFTIAPGLEMSLLSWLHSLLAPLLRWYFDGLVFKTNREPKQ
ncbi:SDR family oxidoreductase [Egbenema bharatensis]|uniref:SDR family oxidoreductase n=1 Tax=Egbenema bharatensis TaxID=3463334 RepID=UPI003A86E2A7